MNFPCPNPIACPGTDSPTLNVSAEGPDVRKFLGYAFFGPPGPSAFNFSGSTGGGQFGGGFMSMVCEADSPEEAALCDPELPTNPPEPTLYRSGRAQCVVDCGDGSTEVFTLIPGSFTALSQAQADAQANAFACQAAQMQCATGVPPTTFTNSAQTCQLICPDFSLGEFTLPAGLLTAFSQADADGAAFELACLVASLLCPGQPPLGFGIPPFGGAGFPPTNPRVRYASASAECTVACSNGSQFTYHVGPGLFVRYSADEANTAAANYACRQASLQLACISSLTQELCAGTFYSELLSVTNMAVDSWLLTGSVPAGMTFEEGQLAGIPTTPGAYTFTITAFAANGNSTQRTYTIDVILLSASLPGGTVDDSYAGQLTQSGAAEPVTWAIVAGSLPPGLALNSATGAITGTPTIAGSYAFTYAMQAADSAECEKAGSIAIDEAALNPTAWWTFEVGGLTLPDVANGNNLDYTADDQLAAFTGKVNKAATLIGAGVDTQYDTAVTAGLGYAGGDINMFGWSVISSVNASTRHSVFLTIGGTVVMSLDFRNDGTWTLTTAATQTSGPIFLGAFFFWRVHYNAATQRWGVAISNGAVSYQGVQSAPAPAGTGKVRLQYLNFGGTVSTQQLDELCLFYSSLTSTQINNIYNGGAGRTFP